MNKPSTGPLNDAIEICQAGFVQRREWMLYRIRGDHYPFNVTMSFKLKQFDHAVFQKVLDLLVAKHEVLRTTLKVIGGRLMQVIHHPEEAKVKFSYYNFIGKESADHSVNTIKSVKGATPFNFEYGPMFRVLVFARSHDQYEVYLVFHHVICDKQSTRIFEADAIRFWQSVTQGNSSVVYDKALQYKVYTAFENKLLDTDLGNGHREYWIAQLRHCKHERLLIADEKAWNTCFANHLAKVKAVRKKIFDLPFFDQRFIGSVVRRYQYGAAGSINYVYAPHTCHYLNEFKQIGTSSLLALFIASFLVTLNKISGQERFVFDIPAMRRNDGDYKNIMGWLTAGGIVPFDMGENSSTGNFLDYIDQQLFLLSKHCVYPFETLGYESENPVGSTVPVFFMLTESGNHYSGAGGSGIVNHQKEGPYSNHDLDIYLTIHNNACTALITYNNFAISPAIIESMVLEQEGVINDILQELMPA